MSAITAYNQTNPFTPMFGKVPAYMAGRELLIDEMVQAFELPDSNPNLCSIFVGARGTGKTALLTYLGYRAQQERIRQRLAECSMTFFRESVMRRLICFPLIARGNLQALVWLRLQACRGRTTLLPGTGERK